MMITEKEISQFNVAQCISARLYAIKITDPEIFNPGGNIVRPTQDDTIEQYERFPVALSLRAMHGGRINEMSDTRYFLSKYDWLARGSRTLGMMRGDSQDGAAAAAFSLLSVLPN